MPPYGIPSNFGDAIVLGKDYSTLQGCINAALAREQWYEVGASVSSGKTVSKTSGSASFVVSAGTFALSDDMRNWFISADAAGTTFNQRKWYPIDYLDGTSTIFAGVAAQETLAGAELKFARPKVTTIIMAQRSVTENVVISAKSACLKFQDGALEGNASQVIERVDSGYIEWNNVRLQSTAGVLFSDSGTPYTSPVVWKRWTDMYVKNSGGLDGNFLKAGVQEIFDGHYEGINHIFTGCHNTKGRLTMKGVVGRSTSLVLGAQPTTYIAKPAPYPIISDCTFEAYCAADSGVAFQFLETVAGVANGAIFENCTFRVARMGAGGSTIKLIQAGGATLEQLRFIGCKWVIDDDVVITAVNRFYLIATNINMTLVDCSFPKNVAWTDVIVAGSVTITHVNNGIPQAIAYAASITPNPHLGDIITVGTLTGNIAVGAPVNPVLGQRFTINYTSDATPGRTITYNAVFKTSAIPISTASAKASQNFVYDGTNWIQTGGALLWL